jgi:hypothetical protein
MLDNLNLLAIVIILLWLGSLAYYFYVSRQQKEIQKDVDWLREQLKDDNESTSQE